MPRIARVVAVGLPHHITQRGNYKQKVFYNDYDRYRYLKYIQKYSEKYCLSLLGYCLMENHVHFIAIPEKKDSLSKTFNTTHMCYAQDINKKNNTKGHLWQGRFYSCVLDQNHFIAALKYIERNPVRAKIVTKPWYWKWSSASAHTGQNQGHVKLHNVFKFMEMDSNSWKQYIDNPDDEETRKKIKKNTLSGLPLGKNDFIEILEKTLGRKIIPSPVGRPQKSK